MPRSILSLLLVFCTLLVFGQDNSIPSSIQVPSDSRLIWHVYAKGVQIYICTPTPTDSAKYSWTFKEPRANLYADSSGHQLIGHHYLNTEKIPTWETNEGSRISGTKLHQTNSPDSTSIPWLLLQAKPGSGSGLLKPTAFIQRIRTSGGSAPAAAGRKGQLAEVAYTAEYLFYGEK